MRNLLIAFSFCLVALLANAAQSEFKLAPGEYLIVAKFQVGNNEPIEQTDQVVMSYSEGKFRFHNSKQPDFPIIGQCFGNKFVAHIDDAAGPVEMVGSLVENNHVIGQMSGSGSKQGDLVGSFEIIPATN